MGFKLIDIHSLISNFFEVMRINVPLVKSYYKFFYDVLVTYVIHEKDNHDTATNILKEQVVTFTLYIIIGI